ncbi:MAG: class E sortase [Rubrobacteraceae bacterium]|nr:class E sortase [Rubrobacter sp.]
MLVPLILLLVLALLVIPVFPRTETASVEVGSTEPGETSHQDSLQERQSSQPRTLLGENLSSETEKAARQADSATKVKIWLTVPRLGLKNVAVRSGSTQADLDREGILRMDASGLPWEEGSNTFIAGHALGFEWTRVKYAFRDLEQMKPGDEIFVRDSAGNKYTFRVYDRMTVRPEDYWVTYPEPGRTLISLQSCVPIPTFENRLVVRGELVS